MDLDPSSVDWKEPKPNFLRSMVKKHVPRKYTFLMCASPRMGCAIIGVLCIILPFIDIVQISQFLYYPTDEIADKDGWMKCPNQWYLKTSPVSSYAIFSTSPLVFLHLVFALIYFLLSLALIIGVTWNLETLIFTVLIGGILVYIPSAAVYLLEIITSFKSSFTKPAAWIFFFSPLIWIYFMAVIHAHVDTLELLRLIKEGVLAKPNVFTKWTPQGE